MDDLDGSFNPERSFQKAAAHAVVTVFSFMCSVVSGFGKHKNDATDG
jgi:hypothetical protein